MNTKRNNESQNKYEHLLDKYVDDAHADYRTRQEREEEARSKYGHLLDYAKPNHKIYEDIIKLDDMCRSVRQQRAEANIQADIRMQERIEREKREQQERTDRNNAFVVENILLFIPYGFACPWVFRRARNLFCCTLIGAVTSLGIESLQLLTRRGYFQIDDILTNTLGTILGFLIYWLWRGVCRIFRGTPAEDKREDL